MSLRCCLKMPVPSEQTHDQLQRALMDEVARLGYPNSIVSIPALEFGEYDPHQRAGKISAVLSIPCGVDLGAVAARLKPDSSLEIDPQISTFDAFPVLDFEMFGDRERAHKLIGASALARASGKGVNVAIIDRGLDSKLFPPETFKGGWWRYAQRGKRLFEPGANASEHAHMIARNVLAIAPRARIWDVPLLSNIDDDPPSIALAEALFYYIRRDIRDGKRRLGYLEKLRSPNVARVLRRPGMTNVVNFDGPWILVNAWGVLNPAQLSEGEGRGYISNPTNKFVQDMAKFSSLIEPKVDVVFAAGNCGEPTALPRCGMDWTGPGRSILGANGHPDVLTVGAVRVDGMPLAYSAQGPGRLGAKWPKNDPDGRLRARMKPDICAPSSFVETDDATVTNSGTSAASGIAAGVLAALRSFELSAGRVPLTPASMRRLVCASARRAGGPDQWDERLGHGVINLREAARLLAV